MTFKREREVEVGDVVVVEVEESKRGEWKMEVVERLVTGPRDNVVRGATVRVITKGKPIRLFQTSSKPLSVGVSERRGGNTNTYRTQPEYRNSDKKSNLIIIYNNLPIYIARIYIC